MSKQPPPAPTASTEGSCPTQIQIIRTPQHWKFAQHHPTRPLPPPPPTPTPPPRLGTDVPEKHFRTKSVNALHPILPVYLNILSPGLGPYSNFEIVIIMFELENIG